MPNSASPREWNSCKRQPATPRSLWTYRSAAEKPAPPPKPRIWSRAGVTSQLVAGLDLEEWPDPLNWSARRRQLERRCTVRFGEDWLRRWQAARPRPTHPELSRATRIGIDQRCDRPITVRTFASPQRPVSAPLA